VIFHINSPLTSTCLSNIYALSILAFPFPYSPARHDGRAIKKPYKQRKSIEYDLDDETRASLDACIDGLIRNLSKDKEITYTTVDAHHDIFHQFTFDYYCKHSHTFPDEKEQEEINAHISSRQEEISSAIQSLSKYSQLFRP
jgi:hypothetical protein